MGVQGIKHTPYAALLGRVPASAFAVGARIRHGKGACRRVVRIVHGVCGRAEMVGGAEE